MKGTIDSTAIKKGRALLAYIFFKTRREARLPLKNLDLYCAINKRIQTLYYYYLYYYY